MCSHFMTQSLIFLPNFYQHLDTILCKTRWDTCSINHLYVHNQDVYVRKMTRMIQYPCSNHAHSPPSPPSNVGIHSSLYILIHLQWEVGNRDFITKCPNSFVQDCRFYSSVIDTMWDPFVCSGGQRPYNKVKGHQKLQDGFKSLDNIFRAFLPPK